MPKRSHEDKGLQRKRKTRTTCDFNRFSRDLFGNPEHWCGSPPPIQLGKGRTDGFQQSGAPSLKPRENDRLAKQRPTSKVPSMMDGRVQYGCIRLIWIVLVALMMMVLLEIPAHARGKQRAGDQPKQPADQQKKIREEENAYKDALKRIPNQKPVDPWNKMR